MAERNIIDLIELARFLTGDNLTESSANGQKKKIRKIEDKPITGLQSASLAAGGNVDIIDEEVKTGRTMIFDGIMAVGVDGCTISIYGENDVPIISGVPGDIIADLVQEGFKYLVPHVITAGNNYRVNVTNTTSSAIASGIKVLVKGAKLYY